MHAADESDVDWSLAHGVPAETIPRLRFGAGIGTWDHERRVRLSVRLGSTGGCFPSAGELIDALVSFNLQLDPVIDGSVVRGLPSCLSSP